MPSMACVAEVTDVSFPLRVRLALALRLLVGSDSEGNFKLRPEWDSDHPGHHGPAAGASDWHGTPNFKFLRLRVRVAGPESESALPT